MSRRRLLRGLWAGLLLGLAISACAPAAAPTPAPAVSTPAGAAEAPGTPTPAALPTRPAAAQATLPPLTATRPPAQQPTATPGLAPTTAPAVEARVVELEWPPRMRLGDSDSVRLALIPSALGYTLTAEFPENTVITRAVQLQRPGGYILSGVARLEGVGFDIAPVADQALPLPEGEAVTWRWTLTPRSSGRHHLALDLRLRWEGPAGTREAQLYSKSLTVEVFSFLGLTTAQAGWLGVIGLAAGGGMSTVAVAWRIRARPRRPRANPDVRLEPPPGLALAPDERWLLQAVFRRYTRVVIESEFRSGYSGARTLLALPLHADGRADAHTIVKLGQRRAVEREFDNYEAHVKDTLPPMTARIQEALVDPARPLAALRYTFIAAPGQQPMSLGQALRRQPDPALLERLFETFGPGWWLQRRTAAFRLAQEYDTLLPAHLVLEPEAGRPQPAAELEPRTTPESLGLAVGACVRLGRFDEVELRQDGRSLSLTGSPMNGAPPLRLRWLSRAAPDGTLARVAATREDLLRELTAGLDLLGLPDPLLRLPALLGETVSGSRSTIHGDLNLENVLVGPGSLIWLIDFARTRDGHPLFDFAHLAAEIIGHVIAPAVDSPQDYLALWDAAAAAERPPAGLPGLLAALRRLAGRCLADPAAPREYDLALYAACLGALKHTTLDLHARHLLYLTAACLAL